MEKGERYTPETVKSDLFLDRFKSKKGKVAAAAVWLTGTIGGGVAIGTAAARYALGEPVTPIKSPEYQKDPYSPFNPDVFTEHPAPNVAPFTPSERNLLSSDLYTELTPTEKVSELNDDLVTNREASLEGDRLLGVPIPLGFDNEERSIPEHHTFGRENDAMDLELTENMLRIPAEVREPLERYVGAQQRETDFFANFAERESCNEKVGVNFFYRGDPPTPGTAEAKARARSEAEALAEAKAKACTGNLQEVYDRWYARSTGEENGRNPRGFASYPEALKGLTSVDLAYLKGLREEQATAWWEATYAADRLYGPNSPHFNKEEKRAAPIPVTAAPYRTPEVHKSSQRSLKYWKHQGRQSDCTNNAKVVITNEIPEPPAMAYADSANCTVSVMVDTSARLQSMASSLEYAGQYSYEEALQREWCELMIHEHGHLLGYEHSANPDSPMYAANQQRPRADRFEPPECG